MSLMRFVLISAAITLACAHAPAQPLSAECEIDPGISHRYIFNPAGPWKIHILRIVPSRAGLTVRSMRAMNTYFGLETTSSMAHRIDDSLYTVIAALNADFFEKNGESYNNQVMGGEIIKGRPPIDCTGPRYRRNRSQFAITASGQPLIGRFVFDGHLFWNDTSVARVGGVNTISSGDSVIIFTHRYNDRIPRVNSRSTFATLRFLSTRDDTLLYTVTETGMLNDSMSVSSNGYIVVNYGSSVRDFPPSSRDTMRILFRFPPAGERIVELVGGFPQIVRDRKNVVDEVDALEGPLARSFGPTRHPRTGVGYTVTGDTLIWTTVDGRQDSSAGMTLSEFADLMISHGVFQGLNLDGGGSTTMVINGTVVNSPSDAKGERPVANCLLLVSRRRPSPSE